jgi:hypothetical protein
MIDKIFSMGHQLRKTIVRRFVVRASSLPPEMQAGKPAPQSNVGH